MGKLAKDILTEAGKQKAFAEANSGKLARQANSEKSVGQAMLTIAGYESPYDKSYEAQASLLRQNKEERLANEWMNNANLELQNAGDEASLDLSFTTSDNTWQKGVDGVAPEYQYIWEMKKETLITEGKKKRVAIQNVEFERETSDGLDADIEAWTNPNSLYSKEDRERILINHRHNIDTIRLRGGQVGGMQLKLKQLTVLSQGRDISQAEFEAIDAQLNGNWKNKYDRGSYEAVAFGKKLIYEDGKQQGKDQGAQAFMVKLPDGTFVLSDAKIKQGIELAKQKYKDANPEWEGWGEGEQGKRLLAEFEEEYRKGVLEGLRSEDNEFGTMRSVLRENPDLATMAVGSAEVKRMVEVDNIEPHKALSANVAINLEQTLFLLKTAGADPNVSIGQMVAIMEAQEAAIPEIFSGEEGKGRKNQLYQSQATWTEEFGTTKDEMIAKAEQIRKDAIADMKKENQAIIDNSARFVSTKGYEVVLPKGINLLDEVGFEYARGLLIDSSFWHYYHNPDGTERLSRPDVIDVVDYVTALHEDSVPPEQRGQLRDMVSDLVRKEKGKKSPNEEGWYDKIRGRYGSPARESGKSISPISFTIGPVEFNSMNLPTVEDNRLGRQLLDFYANFDQVNPTVQNKYQTQGFSFDGSIMGRVEAFLAHGEVPHGVYTPNENYESFHEQYVDKTPPVIYAATQYMSNDRWVPWFYIASTADAKAIDAAGKLVGKPSTDWVEHGLIFPIHQNEKRVMTDGELSDLLGGIIQASGAKTSAGDRVAGGGFADVDWDWSKWEAIRAAPQVFAPRYNWNMELRTFLREKLDNGEFKLVDADVRDGGKTTIVRVLDTTTGRFVDDMEFEISSLQGVK